MKNYGGMIHFSENGDWFADELVVRGGRHVNPFRQVRAYKFAILNYFHNRGTRFLERQREMGWGQISGMVLFGKPIQFDEHHVLLQWRCRTFSDASGNKIEALLIGFDPFVSECEL